jgi:hypothetical protein
MPLVPFPLLERTKEKIDKNPTFYYSGVVSKEKKEMTRPFFFGLLRKSFQFFLLFKKKLTIKWGDEVTS